MFQTTLSGLALAAAISMSAPLAPAQNTPEPQSVSIRETLGLDLRNRTYSTKSADAIVGVLQFDTPSVSPAVIRATLPVPPNTFNGTESTMPLVLVDANMNPIETQLEIVARHPGDGAGASVVELIGRMDIPAGTGSSMTMYVKRSAVPRSPIPANPTVADFVNAPKDVPAPVKSMLNNPAQLQLAAEDVFGNIYILDLIQGYDYDHGDRRTQRFGPVRSEFRHHGWMRPIFPKSGPQGTLPHLFGVHAYVRITAGDPVIELDLRIHNGADGQTSKNEALPDVYFRNLSLLVPHGWTAAPDIKDPGIGAPIDVGPFQAFPLVDVLDDGKLHYMPQLAQMERRFVLAPHVESERLISHIKQEGLGFATPGPGASDAPLFWSWWNSKTSFYFPQAHTLPRLAQIPTSKLRSDLLNDWKYLSTHFKNGTGAASYPISSDVYGWAHPYGIAYGGMTGGDGIQFFWGVKTLVAGSLTGYRRMQLLHRMDTERMPNAFYAPDGTPSQINDWLTTFASTTYLPFYFYMGPTGSADPFGLTTAPTFQTDYVKSNGLDPSYEATLSNYKKLDIQHLVRYTGPAKALAWLGNDSMAKDDLELQAELFHMTYHKYENSKYHHVQGTTMLADRKFVDTYPGIGFDFGRGAAWGLDAMTAAYQLGSLDFRERKFGWFKDVTELLSDGQGACSGIIQATVYIKMLGGQFRTSQVIEASITQNALFGAVRSVMHQKDPYHAYLMADILGKSLRGLIRPEAWDPNSYAPYTQLAVGPLDETLPLFCGQPPPGGQSSNLDAYQQWASMAYGMEATGDSSFILYAEKMLGMPLKNILQDTETKNLGNTAALIALAEKIWPAG